MAHARFERNDMHWMYFLSLEEDLRVVARYIEITEVNMDVFSIECTRLLLAACAEVDVVTKLLASTCLNREARNMGECRSVLVESYPILTSAVISIPRHNLDLTPWASWEEERQPQWWDDYNQVKHHRDERFAQASLRNTLHALAGLYVVLLVYLRSKGVDIIMPATTFLHPYWQLGSYCISPEGHLIDLRPENFRPPY